MKSLSIFVLCVTTSMASAQSNPNQARADAFFAEGRDLLVNKNDAKGACEKFEQAIALDPTAPGVMLNLGLCYEMQGKFATSLYWFRKAQFAASEAKPKPLTEYEEAAKQHTQDLSEKVAIAKIDVERVAPESKGSMRISIDGRPVRGEDYLRLEVDSGSVIEARAPGKAVFRQQVEIDGRTAKDIVIVFTDEVIPPLRDPGKGRRRLAWIVGAGGVAIYGVTLVYALNVRGKYNDPGGVYGGADGYENAKRDLRYYGTGLFAAGTIVVGSAFVLYFTAPKPYRERTDQTVFAPIVSPESVGVGVSGSF